MRQPAQAIPLLFIIFFGFISLSLPYPIFAPLFLSEDSSFSTILGLAPHWRTLLLGLTLAAYPFTQFFGSPIMGSLSDRYGRKRILILSLIGTGAGYLLSALSIAYNQIGLLMLSRALTGFFEGNMGIAQACVADMKYDKYHGLGAISAASSLGYLIGPLIGGFLCDQTLVAWFHYETPFYMGSVTALLLACVVGLWFQETKQLISKPHALFSEFNIFKKIRLVYRRPVLRNAFIMFVLLSLSIDCYYEFYPAFLVEKWDMTPKWIGLYSVTLSLALSIGSLWLPHILRKKKNPIAYRPHLLLIFVFAMGLLLVASGPIGLNVHFFIVGLSYSAINIIQTVIISDNVDEHEQGEVMGLQWGLRMLGDSALCIVGSLLLWGSSTWPIALSIFFACVTLWVVLARTRPISSA